MIRMHWRCGGPRMARAVRLAGFLKITDQCSHTILEVGDHILGHQRQALVAADKGFDR